jgi:hypothetical protein
MKGFLQVTSACKADILTAADIPSFVGNIIYLFYKTSYLNEEVNRNEAFRLVFVPCFFSFVIDYAAK